MFQIKHAKIFADGSTENFIHFLERMANCMKTAVMLMILSFAGCKTRHMNESQVKNDELAAPNDAIGQSPDNLLGFGYTPNQKNELAAKYISPAIRNIEACKEKNHLEVLSDLKYRFETADKLEQREFQLRESVSLDKWKSRYNHWAMYVSGVGIAAAGIYVAGPILGSGALSGAALATVEGSSVAATGVLGMGLVSIPIMTNGISMLAKLHPDKYGRFAVWGYNSQPVNKRVVLDTYAMEPKLVSYVKDLYVSEIKKSHDELTEWYEKNRKTEFKMQYLGLDILNAADIEMVLSFERIERYRRDKGVFARLYGETFQMCSIISEKT